MKYIKSYEQLNDDPQIGEYIISYIPKNKVQNRDNNLHIGKIVDKKNIITKNNIYKIHYYKDNFQQWWKDTDWWIIRSEIIDHSYNQNDLEYVKIAAQFNL